MPLPRAEAALALGIKPTSFAALAISEKAGTDILAVVSSGWKMGWRASVDASDGIWYRGYGL
jgi:hypothetical protein